MSQLEFLLRKVLDAVIVMRCDGTVAEWNACAEVTFGWSREEALGQSMNALIVPPQHRQAHAHGLDRYLRTGEAEVLDRRIEISACDKAGREFPVELSITEAEFLGERVFIGFLRDISARKSAELALRESEARLAATYNHAFAGIAEVDRDGRILRSNDEYARITGYGPEELQATSIFAITHPDDLPEDRKLFARQWAGELENYSVEKRYLRGDGGIVWVEVAASIVPAPDDRDTFAIRIVRDVTERKSAEQHQQLLLTELNHRVKNILTVVQSLAQQSFKGEASPQALISAFQDRLAALAHAHDLLVRGSWTPTPIQLVIEQALTPFDTSRFRVQGDTVLLHPQTAVTFGLAMHELATNASKYGALSVSTGRVDIAWSNAQDYLRFTWREQGGPPVTQPSREGFGTRLLQRGLARELKGEVALDYLPEGLVCTIVWPVPADA